MNEVWSVFGRLVLDDSEYNDDLSRDERQTKKSTNKMNEGFKKVGKGITVMTGALTGASVALGGLVLNASESAAEINKFSQVTGTTTDEFQRWDAVMKATGFSMEQASGDLAALGEKAMDAANGVGEGAELFGLLGVQVTDTSGKMKTQGQIFDETIKSLQSMEDITQRNAIASALLSTTGEELVPILNMTNEELESMKSNANVINQDQLDKAAEFKQGYDEIQQSLRAVVTELGIQFMPLLSGLFTWVQSNMPVIQKTFETVFQAVSVVLNVVGDIFTTYIQPALVTLFDFVVENWPMIQSIGEEVFSSLFDVVKVLWDMFENSLLPILKTLWEFIEPTFPLIGKVIETAFDVIIESAKAVIQIFGAVLDAIQSAISAIDKFFNKQKKIKDVTFESTGEGFLGGTIKGRANGGPVTAGMAYRINERTSNSEIFIPGSSGTVMASSGQTIVLNINNPKVFDTRDANKLGEVLVKTLRGKGINPNG